MTDPPASPFQGINFTVVAAADERQIEWRRKSVVRIRATRAGRLEALAKDKTAINRAVAEYERLDKGNATNIGLRAGFVRVGRDAEAERKALRARRDGTGDVPPADATSEADALQEDHGSPSPAGDQDDLDVATEKRLARQEQRGRPPLTKLLTHPTGLKLLLSAIYLTHLEEIPGGYFANRRHNNKLEGPRESWAVAAGLHRAPNRRARRVRLVGALEALRDRGLVQLPVGSNEGWQLLREDGTEDAYRLPSPGQEDLVVLPSLFFERGWHLVLTPPEITLLLALTNLDRRLRRDRSDAEIDRTGIALPQSVRFDAYGISGEAYEAVHQLDELGLIELHDPMPNRRRGKIHPPTEEEILAADNAEGDLAPQPYRFRLGQPQVYDRSALEALTKALRSYPLGRRLEEWPELMPRIL